MIRKSLLLFALLSVAFLCSRCNSTINQPEPYSTDSDTMRIVMHQTCNNTKYNIQLRVDSLLNDSRCPPVAVCFWAGNIQVKFELITAEKAHHQLLLNSTLLPRDTSIAGINYKLVDVTPVSVVKGNYDYKLTKTTVVASRK